MQTDATFAVADDGNRLKENKNTDASLVRVFISEDDRKNGESQGITVWYEGTKIQRLGHAANILALVGSIGVF